MSQSEGNTQEVVEHLCVNASVFFAGMLLLSYTGSCGFSVVFVRNFVASFYFSGKLLQCFIVLICWILGLACSIPITLLNNLLYGMCLENMEPYEFKV